MGDFNIKIKVDANGNPVGVSIPGAGAGAGMAVGQVTSQTRKEAKELKFDMQSIMTESIRTMGQVFRERNMGSGQTGANMTALGIGQGVAQQAASMGVASGNPYLAAGGMAVSEGLGIMKQILGEVSAMPKMKATQQVEQVAAQYALAGSPLDTKTLQKLLDRAYAVEKSIQQQQYIVRGQAGSRTDEYRSKGYSEWGARWKAANEYVLDWVLWRDNERDLQVRRDKSSAQRRTAGD